MRVLVNGLGCTYTGARFILEQLLQASPVDVRITAIIPVVEGVHSAKFPAHVKVIGLNHAIWGSWLRPFVELWINASLWLGRYDEYINLSNYGLCFSSKQSLYIHNPLLLDMTVEKKLGQGHPNIFIRFALKTFLRNGERIFVQTEHMLGQLVAYCSSNDIPFPTSVFVLRPLLPDHPAQPGKLTRDFAFQLFYPASDFPHKRTDLAILGTLAARRLHPEIGLALTASSLSAVAGIRFLGVLSREDVYRFHATSDALLFTSERETLGLPLLEALYLDKPAVLPDRSYAREIYAEAGVYYKQDSPEAIGEAIGRLYNNYDQYVNLVAKRKLAERKGRISWAEHWKVFLNRDLPL